jgi:hypothetical protein
MDFWVLTPLKEFDEIYFLLVLILTISRSILSEFTCVTS